MRSAVGCLVIVILSPGALGSRLGNRRKQDILTTRVEIRANSSIVLMQQGRQLDDETDESNELVILGQEGSPDDVFPLRRCAGDCDSDAECASNYLCFQRSGYTPVPGCTGDGSRAKDYCVDPADIKETIAPSVAPTVDGILVLLGQEGLPEEAFPLPRCAGDCDDDSECHTPFVCFQRSGYTPVPGCTGLGSRAKGWCTNSLDYCVDPLDIPQSNEPSMAPSAEPSMTQVTLDENKTMAPTPGFTPQERAGTTLQLASRLEIVAENGDPSSSYPLDPTTEVFQLKMFWHESFRWQGRDVHVRWCITCDGRSCDLLDIVRIVRCDGDNTRFKFLTPVDGEGMLIQVDGTDLCMTVVGIRGITKLKPCNDKWDKQIWLIGQGSIEENIFDLRPKTNYSNCLTQHHHPKKDEEVHAKWDCETVHRHKTGFWRKY